MGPTWIGREEATFRSSVPGQTDSELNDPDLSGSVVDPLASPAPIDLSTGGDPGLDAPLPEGLVPAASSRSKFRPPRARVRRPEPAPFNMMDLDPLSVDPALPGTEPTTDDMQAGPGAEQDSFEQTGKRRGSRGAKRRTSRNRADRDESGEGMAARLSGVGGWKLATAVLTAVAMLAVGWGVYESTKLSRTESALRVTGASASAQIQGLEGRMAALEASNTQTSSELADIQQQLTDFTGSVASAQESAKQSYDKVSQSVSVAPADYKSAVAQASALSTAYLTAKAAADSAPADQEAQVKSLEAKSLLLANCAKIWAGATQQVFTSDNPTEAMSTVGKDLATAAPACKVVTQ
jgi:hypothetical protein